MSVTVARWHVACMRQNCDRPASGATRVPCYACNDPFLEHGRVYAATCFSMVNHFLHLGMRVVTVIASFSQLQVFEQLQWTLLRTKGVRMNKQ